jgi:hypothetical protein
MGHHREWHPQEVAGCFGCQTLNVGVQTLQIKHGSNPVQTKPVVSERNGRKVGEHRVHWDGRQDALAQPGPIKLQTRVQAE